ncbi:MAG: diguanylate cyclase, partial [Campylobacterota bacterium]|nr:diguanylate cyclase [Campylobacterota bacterium]
MGSYLIDINNFVNINNVYGFRVGDIVLKEFANILKKIAKENSCRLYSLSGDEFVFVTLETIVPGKCIEIAKYLVENIEKTGINLKIDGADVNIFLSVTIGISYGEEEPLLAADMALKYAVKKRLPYMLYTKELHIEKDFSDHIRWTKTILDAIKEDRVYPFFQPIVYEETKVKYECLIRIIEDDKVISPFFFLDIAKKIRYYTTLTKIMIEKSFKEFEKRENEFSINFSFEDILDESVVSFLIENIKKYKINKKLII